MYDTEGFTVEEIFEEYFEYGQQIAQYVCDTSVVLNDALDNNHRVLFEGAQGVMLDIDHGTYPFVTSSSNCWWCNSWNWSWSCESYSRCRCM